MIADSWCAVYLPWYHTYRERDIRFVLAVMIGPSRILWLRQIDRLAGAAVFGGHPLGEGRPAGQLPAIQNERRIRVNHILLGADPVLR